MYVCMSECVLCNLWGKHHPLHVYCCMWCDVHVSLCVTQRAPSPPSDTQAHKHKHLELNEAELSLVPISLIINIFSLPLNTLINLQRRLWVCVCACQCLCIVADKTCCCMYSMWTHVQICTLLPVCRWCYAKEIPHTSHYKLHLPAIYTSES